MLFFRSQATTSGWVWCKLLSPPEKLIKEQSLTMCDIICLPSQVQFGLSMRPHWWSGAAHQLWLVRWWWSLTLQIKGGLNRLCGQAIGRYLSPVELPSFSTMHPRCSKSSLGNVTKLGSRWQALDGKRRCMDGRTDPSGWASLAGDELIQWI